MNVLVVLIFSGIITEWKVVNMLLVFMFFIYARRKVVPCMLIQRIYLLSIGDLFCMNFIGNLFNSIQNYLFLTIERNKTISALLK